MCYHRSFIVTEELKVLSHPTSDHHTDIRVFHKIREPGMHHSPPHVAVEFTPHQSLFQTGGWMFILDQIERPKWYDETTIQELAREKLEVEHKQAIVNDSTYVSTRSLEIPYLNKIDPGTTIVSRGDVIIGRSAMERGLRGVTIVARTLLLDIAAPSQIPSDCLFIGDLSPRMHPNAIRELIETRQARYVQRPEDMYITPFSAYDILATTGLPKSYFKP